MTVLKCLDCSGLQRKEVTLCTVTSCPLHPLRPFQYVDPCTGPRISATAAAPSFTRMWVVSALTASASVVLSRLAFLACWLSREPGEHA